MPSRRQMLQRSAGLAGLLAGLGLLPQAAQAAFNAAAFEAKSLPLTIHGVLENYLKTHSPVSPGYEGRVQADDLPPRVWSHKSVSSASAKE